MDNKKIDKFQERQNRIKNKARKKFQALEHLGAALKLIADCMFEDIDDLTRKRNGD